MATETKTNFRTVVEDAKEYARTSVELAKMKGAEKTSTAISNTVVYAVLGILTLFILTFGSITLGFALAGALDNIVWGFLIVTGIYVVLAAIVWLGKDRLIKLPILNKVIEKMNKTERNITNATGKRSQRVSAQGMGA